MKIEENISLKDFTTFRTGGNARYFVRVKNIDELKIAVRFTKEKNLPFFVLGRGANVLISDDGFCGVVIKMEMKGIKFEKLKNRMTRAISGAGEDWDNFVLQTVKKDLVGLENLTLVPSTVGATPVQNVNCYGREVSDTIAWIETLNAETVEIKIFSPKECEFSYRESFFKTPEGKKYIITRVAFDLLKDGTLKTDYKDVKEYFFAHKIINPTVRDVRNALIEIRTKKLPDIRKDYTAGSFFKNIVLSDALADEIIKKYPDIAVYPATKGKKKLATAWVLDHICGLRGVQKGNVGTYKNQALIIVNNSNATTKEILDFAEFLRASVKEKIGIDLETEVQVIK